MRRDEPLTLQKLFSLAADLGLWTLVVFVLLLFVLGRFAWPKMIEGLKKREDRIRGALEEAHHRGAKTVLLTFNPNAAFNMDHGSFIKIAIPTGPEVVTGSTRLSHSSLGLRAEKSFPLPD